MEEMPDKLKKVREGIAEAIYTDWAINGAPWDKTLPGEKTPWLKTADAVMRKEASQGIVIKGSNYFYGDKELWSVEPLIKEQI